MGRCIAQSLSEELGIPFYDRDIVEQTAKRMELPISTISQEEENVRSVYFKRQYPLGMGIQSMQDEIYMVQQNIIRDLAERESCILWEGAVTVFWPTIPAALVFYLCPLQGAL